MRLSNKPRLQGAFGAGRRDRHPNLGRYVLKDCAK